MLYNIQSTRVGVLFVFFVLLYLVALSNLYFIQINQSDYFEQIAHKQYQVTITKAPPRAPITDRNGKLLALNKESMSAFITPHALNKPEELMQFLKKEYPKVAATLQEKKNARFVYIKRRLTDEQMKELEDLGLSDIKFLSEPSRFYPIESLGPVIGITDIDNQGTMGLELLYNNLLAGKPETYILEKDARSGHFYFTRTTTISGSQGTPVKLTIDSTLQFLVHQELKDALKTYGSSEASAIVLNGTTGEIISLATLPDFNPNNTEDLNITFTKNRAIADAHEFGSIIKIFLALAALEEKVTSPEELIDCESTTKTKLNGFAFTTWKAHGLQTFSQVIEGSNNIGVAKVALRLGEKLYTHYKKLGFGKKVGIFPGEHIGFVNPPKNWSHASAITLSFGYEMNATLLQVARAATVICNNGTLVQPSIILDSFPNRTQLYTNDTIEQLRDILSKTAHNKFHLESIPGLMIMGKTGTARMLTNGVYDHKKHIFTYVGIIEKGDYKRIIITCLKECTQKNPYASTTAAPLFEKIAHKMIIHDQMI